MQDNPKSFSCPLFAIPHSVPRMSIHRSWVHQLVVQGNVPLLLIGWVIQQV